MKNGNVDTECFDLLYQLQFQRGLSPVYILLTKAGFIVLSIFLYMMWNGYGDMRLVFLAVIVFWYLYRNHFDYKYYERERVWLLSLWKDLTTIRKKKPFKSRKYS